MELWMRHKRGKVIIIFFSFLFFFSSCAKPRFARTYGCDVEKGIQVSKCGKGHSTEQRTIQAKQDAHAQFAYDMYTAPNNDNIIIESRPLPVAAKLLDLVFSSHEWDALSWLAIGGKKIRTCTFATYKNEWIESNLSQVLQFTFLVVVVVQVTGRR